MDLFALDRVVIAFIKRLMTDSQLLFAVLIILLFCVTVFQSANKGRSR
jgi:hypothetical protein